MGAQRTTTRTLDLLDEPQDARPVRYDAIPDGWHHAPLVERLHALPEARRETALAAGFGVAAFAVGFVGVAAVLLDRTLPFLLLLAVALVVAFVPRPDDTVVRERLATWRRDLAEHVGAEPPGDGEAR